MCHAFQSMGVDVTLGVPAERVPESRVSNNIVQKLGKTPTFKVKCFSHFTVAGRFRAAGAYFSTRSFLKSYGDSDFCFMRSPLLARLPLNMGQKVIFESHGVVINTKSKLLDSIYRHQLLHCAQSSNMVLFITISDALANIWKKMGVPANKILALHDGFSAEDYETVTSRQEARQLLGIAAKNKIVVYAGSLYKDRGIEKILRLAKTFSNVDFYVVGGPEENRRFYEVLSTGEGLTNVFFTGHISPPKVRDYLFAADVLLMIWGKQVPTINVCSPLKCFEYMAARRIIIGPAFPTIREIFVDGENALLSDPYSYDALEKKLSEALSLEYPNRLAENARKLAIKEYSWQKRAKRILDALNVSR